MNEELFIVARSFDSYKIFMLDEYGVYRTLMVLDSAYSWGEAAKAICDALRNCKPLILPVPDKTQ